MHKNQEFLQVSMKEFIEMEHTSVESGSSKGRGDDTVPPQMMNGYMEKVVKREYELRAFTDRSLSYSWVILPIVFYLTSVIGGLMTSISIGNVYAAFDNYCILNGNFTLKDMSSIKSKTIEQINFEKVTWGSKFDCEFTEYASVACVLYSGVWIVMVLQCGRGGASRRGFRLPDAWRIVPPTCLGNLIVLFISSAVLDKVTSGFSSFCENILAQKQFGNATCLDILEYHFYLDKYNTDLVQEYEVSHIGAIVQLVGCLLGVCVVSLRCCLAPDFEVYERTLRGYVPAKTEDPEDEEEDLFNSCNSEPGDFSPMTIKTTSVECHNPGLLMDPDDQDFLDSLGSHKELLISKT